MTLKKISKHPFPTVFQLYCESTWGQQLFIVGSCKELGSWNPNAAIKMEWTVGNIWKVQIGLFEGKHEFKYYISDGNTITWEKRNRNVEEKGHCRITYPVVNGIWEYYSQENTMVASTMPPKKKKLKLANNSTLIQSERKRKIESKVKSIREVNQFGSFPTPQPVKPPHQTWVSNKVKSHLTASPKVPTRKSTQRNLYALKKNRQEYLRKQLSSSEVEFSTDNAMENPKELRADIWMKRDKSILRYKKLDMRKNKRQKHCKDPRDNTRKKEQYVQLQMALFC